MKSLCPGVAEWLSLLDGETTENRAKALRAHASECPACGRELALQSQLIADLSASVPVAPGGVEAIIARLPRARSVAKSHQRKWIVPGAVLALAMAAGLLLIPRVAKDPGTFNARGGDKVGWVQKVGAEVFFLGPPLVKLEPGARLAPGAALVGRYHNVDTSPAYLMVLGRDAHSEWHWLYPGFQSPKSDPSSVPLEPQQVSHALPDSVVFDDLPLGEFELITLITRGPLRVSRLEALPKAERSVASLRALFMDARITGIPLRIVATTPDPKETQ